MSSIPRRKFLGSAAGGAALSLPFATSARAATNTSHTSPAGHSRPRLDLWPRQAARRLQHLIAASAGRGAYVTFDADNTMWRYDLEESLLPFLEMKGVLSPDKIDSSLRLIPFHHKESLYSYYLRLCEIDDKVGYPWVAQVFSGLSLGELKRHVDALFTHREPIPVTYRQHGRVVHDKVNPPQIFQAQRQLIHELRAHGITVYVVSAAHEELVRMVVSDPAYDLGVEPQHVIGVTTLLRNPSTGDVTTARKQLADGHTPWEHGYPNTDRRHLVVTPYLWSPATWYVGKRAGIHDYIADYQRPILAGGDSPSDWSMLFYVDVRAGGARLWVDRDQDYTTALTKKRKKRAAEQHHAHTPVDADRGWITVTPEELHPQPMQAHSTHHTGHPA